MLRMRPIATDLPRETRVLTRIPSSLLETPRGRWQIRPCSSKDAHSRTDVRLDHRGVLQDQFYAKTLDVRQSRRATLNVLQARSFLLCWPFSIAPPHGALSHPLAALFSVPCELSSGKTRTSSTAWGVHWMHEPFGVGVRWAVWIKSRPPPHLPEGAQ